MIYSIFRIVYRPARAIVASLLVALVASCAHKSIDQTLITLQTSLGEIVLVVDKANAPTASAYFIDLVESGAYDGASFYRSAALTESEELQLIQGGVLGDVVRVGQTTNVDRSKLPMLDDFETTMDTGNLHEFATVSLARDLLDTGKVIPELVICLTDIPQMDFGGRVKPDSRGFPTFGRVVSGMEVVKAISARPTNPLSSIAFLNGQILTEPVVIARAFVNQAKHEK